MISAVRTTSRARGSSVGFTLLEIVIVIAIIAVLGGGAISFMVYNSSTRKLQKAAGEIEQMAKRARAVAILRQAPYALVFREGTVKMGPLAEVGVEDSEVIKELDGIAVEEGRSVPVRASFSVDGGMLIGVRRWGSGDWVMFDDEREVMVWRFDPVGLCEPVGVRYEIDDGESWLEQEFHPLTAGVRDFAMMAQ